MAAPDPVKQEIQRLPPPLRELVEAELAAGNAVAEVLRCHPVPPAGAGVILARPVTTRARASGGGVRFHARNSSLYSGEFSDEARMHFVVEAPLPPPPPPDMDAIRAAHAAPPPEAPEVPAASTAWHRFQASRALDYEKWHDGIGYDLGAIDELSDEEREAACLQLVDQGIEDWRDVEALAHLGTGLARAALREALDEGCNLVVRNAILDRLPELVAEKERVDFIVDGLEHGEFHHGLSETLALVEQCHPPEVIEALLRGARWREGGVAVHFAAMLKFLHGKADTRFDMEQRPFFLRFNTTDSRERAAVFEQLCAEIGVDPKPYARKPPPRKAASIALRKAELRRQAAERLFPSEKAAMIEEATEEPSAEETEWTPPEAPPPPFEVHLDSVAGRIHYQEPGRRTSVECFFEGGQPRLRMATLTLWSDDRGDAAGKMSELDRALVLGRIAEVCMGRLGLTGLEFRP